MIAPEPAVIACLAGLTLMGALPRVFFRTGSLHLRWWLAAAPFNAMAVTLVAGLAGVLEPWSGSEAWMAAGPALGALLAVLSAALIGWTVGTHEAPVSLWHQSDDTPARLVTHGPYQWVRHPFYTAFLLLLTGSTLAFPHPLTATIWIAGVIVINGTAAREEARILESVHGERYREYLRRTRRFVPRLGAPRAG